MDQTNTQQHFRHRVLASPFPMIATLILYSIFSSGPLRTRALLLILLSIPFYSFHIAAPSRLGLFRETALLLEEIKIFGARAYCLFTGQSSLSQRLKNKHRDNVISYYNNVSQNSPILWRAITNDLHAFFQARRLASVFAGLATTAGLSLPFVAPETFTFGNGTEAVYTFTLDLAVFMIFSRVAGERLVLRLLEAHYSLGLNNSSIVRFRGAPILAILGASIGALAGLLIVTTGALASGIESAWGNSSYNFMVASFWFIKENVPTAIGLSMAAGAIIGTGIGFSEKKAGAQ